MPDGGSELERLARIETKLDDVPGVIAAAVAAGIGPALLEIGRHDERIDSLERSAKGLWAAVGAAGMVLVGEIFYLWHATATAAVTVLK